MPIITPGSVLVAAGEADERVVGVRAHRPASIESAISSRETRLMRMPRWFIETPSETEMVVNGTATA